MTPAMMNLLRRKVEPYVTLDPEKGREANFWADLAVGMTPGVGTAQAGRDFERARREDDPLGMGLAATAAIPLVGKPVAVAGKAARKAAALRKVKSAPELAAAAPKPRKAAEIEEALEPAADKAPLARRLRNTKEAVDARVARAQEFLAQPTEPWQAREYAFPRGPIKEALGGWPGQAQTQFPRHQATGRTDLSHVQEAYADPRNRELIKTQILRGLPLGGETFYASLWPIAQEAMSRGIPREDVVKWIEATSGSSARNSIINEQAVGNALMAAKLRGQDINDPAVLAAIRGSFKESMGIGLPAMPVHAGAVSSVLEGNDLASKLQAPYRLAADAPEAKLPTYGRNKAGDFGKSATLDVHEAQGQMLGSQSFPYFKESGGFKPAEYGVAEPEFLKIADELGVPGGTAQAGRWFGGGELTGLASPRGDALDIIEKQVAYTLKQKGQDYSPAAVRDYTMKLIQEGGELAPWFKKQHMPDVRF